MTLVKLFIFLTFHGLSLATGNHTNVAEGTSYYEPSPSKPLFSLTIGNGVTFTQTLSAPVATDTTHVSMATASDISPAVNRAQTDIFCSSGSLTVQTASLASFPRGIWSYFDNTAISLITETARYGTELVYEPARATSTGFEPSVIKLVATPTITTALSTNTDVSTVYFTTTWEQTFYTTFCPETADGGTVSATIWVPPFAVITINGAISTLVPSATSVAFSRVWPSTSSLKIFPVTNSAVSEMEPDRSVDSSEAQFFTQQNQRSTATRLGSKATQSADATLYPTFETIYVSTVAVSELSTVDNFQQPSTSQENINYSRLPSTRGFETIFSRLSHLSFDPSLLESTLPPFSNHSTTIYDGSTTGGPPFFNIPSSQAPTPSTIVTTTHNSLAFTGTGPSLPRIAPPPGFTTFFSSNYAFPSFTTTTVIGEPTFQVSVHSVAIANHHIGNRLMWLLVVLPVLLM